MSPKPLVANQTTALLLDAAKAGTDATRSAERLALADLQAMVEQGYIARIRKLAGVSQDVLAATLGISQAAVSQYERGIVPTDPAVALSLHSLVRALESVLVAEGKLAQRAEHPQNWSPPSPVVPAPHLVRS